MAGFLLEVSRAAMVLKTIITWFVLLFSIVINCDPVRAELFIHSQSEVEIELTGYNGLAEISLYKSRLEAGSKHQINTHYRGLALLVFAGGQRYPVIIGDESFTLKIAAPAEPPSFVGSNENGFFYQSLLGGDSPPGQYGFALLVIQAINLQESSQSIRTVKELADKKREFHEFVRKHYHNLKHSDMVQRLIMQYFMMHEYVDYHTDGTPATDIRAKYHKAVLNGVGEWLEILQPHLPEQEVINYCVSLYFNRSMVTLANLIIENYKDVAFCPGAEEKTFSFPGDMLIIQSGGNKERKLDDLKGNKMFAFVSEDCPVSMVATISKARRLAATKGSMPMIIAPLQELSNSHLSMTRMIRNGNMFFVNDEEWRKQNLTKKVKLPLFFLIGDDIPK